MTITRTQLAERAREVVGTFAGDEDGRRSQLAVALSHGAGGAPVVSPPPRFAHCSVCDCPAPRVIHGFPVCSYHYENGEDDPPCPECSPC